MEKGKTSTVKTGGTPSERFNRIVSSLSIKKDSKSEGGYTYRTLPAMLEKIKPMLEKENLLLHFKNTITEVGGYIYLETEASIFDLKNEKPLKVIASKGFAKEEISGELKDPQRTGSASTYAKKYALASLFLVDDGEVDPDKTKKKKKKKEEVLTDEHINKYLKLMDEFSAITKKEIPKERVDKYIQDLTIDNYDYQISNIKKAISNQTKQND